MLGGDEAGVLFKDYCWSEWKEKYGTKPPWGDKEFKQLATAKSRFDSEDIARAAWTSFLASGDDFTTGHAPGLFLSTISRWTAKAVKMPRMRRDKMKADDQWTERTNTLIRLHKEVNADNTIPEPMKRDEVSKRFKELFPENQYVSVKIISASGSPGDGTPDIVMRGGEYKKK